MNSRWGGHNLRLQHDWHVSDKDVLGAIANVRFSDSGSDSGNGSTIPTIGHGVLRLRNCTR